MQPRRERAVGQAGHERAGQGTLDGEHGEGVGGVQHVDVKAWAMLLKPGKVALVVGGVGDD